MARIAYFDCISGISGDMTLGALMDLGADPAAIESAVRSLGLPDVRLRTETVKKCGFRALSVTVEHPPEHAHRHLHHITEMIDGASEIEPEAKQIAHRIFGQLAEAEAKVHGTTIQKVHFHEVGAVDSIADIVGSAVGMHALGIDSLIASPVPTGTGEITIAHGRVSIPAPATAELLRGIPIAASDIRAELTTPTGAAILKACAESFGPLPAMTIEAVGYGAGDRDLDGQANVLRVLMGQRSADDTALGREVESVTVVMLETNLDDCSGEQIADCIERVRQAGALDAFQMPCVMKKGRAGVLLSVICPPGRVGLIETTIFQHSSSIGIRRWTAHRHKLHRESQTVETPFGPVRGKVVTLPDGQRRFTVEDDDARQAATTYKTTALDVRQAALKAWNA